MTGPDAYTAAWLAEMWPCVHEPDHEQRRREREAAALLAAQEEQRRAAERLPEPRRKAA